MATASPGYHTAVWAGTGGQGRHKVDSLMTSAHYSHYLAGLCRAHWSAGCRYDDESALMLRGCTTRAPVHTLHRQQGRTLGGKTFVDCQV